MSRMKVFENLNQSVDLASHPAYQTLIRLMTVDGKIPYRQALRRLLPHEVSIVHELMGQDDIKWIDCDDPDFAACNVLVSYTRMGKASFYIVGDETPDDGAELIGGLHLPPAMIDRICDEAKQARLLEQRERRLLDQMLLDWQAQGLLSDKIDDVADWVDHVETVYIHVDRHIFARSDVGNNLLRDKELEQLKDRPLTDWSPSERLFVAGIHLLFQTGRSIRFEEFNGLEMSATALHHWLRDKLVLYSEALGRDVQDSELTQPPYELATQVGRLAQELDRTGWLRLRRINGITITKEEMLIAPAEAAARQIETLPDLLVQFAAQKVDLVIDPHQDPEQSMSLITRAAAQQDAADGNSALVEEILQRIVLSAVLEADADYAMSSSIRNFARLQGTADDRAAGALSMTKPDFFTCTLPHPQRTSYIPDIGMANILSQVAARMEFNRWHFVVGNFERAEIPKGRHYYFPPAMPDMAEWSDVWHGGHAQASVRFTVRAPGAQLWKDPFEAFGTPYRGIYDIRLVRMQGPAFTKEEVWSASRHTTLIDAFWRTMITMIQAGESTPTIQAFSKDWYMTLQWKQTLSDCLPLEQPQR